MNLRPASTVCEARTCGRHTSSPQRELWVHDVKLNQAREASDMIGARDYVAPPGLSFERLQLTHSLRCGLPIFRWLSPTR
jgi:hypothetical protein